MSSFSVPICKIDKVYPHENADKLEIATLEGLGYRCIVLKGHYKPGDSVFYIPVDAVVPAEVAENLLDLDYLKKNGRVRAIKLRGVYSEGIIMPLRYEFGVDWKKYRQGDDISKEFGITKYEPPARGGKFSADEVKYSHPQFVKYTNIENIKKYPNVLDLNEKVTVTEKLHGSNVRFGWLTKPQEHLSLWDKIKIFFGGKYPIELVIGSHNKQVAHKNNIYYEATKPYHERTKKFVGIIFFGELIGPGVQKNYEYGLEQHQVVFFDIYSVKEKRYFNRDWFLALTKHLNVMTAPLINSNTWSIIKESKPSGPSLFYPGQEVIEGWVIKPDKERTYPSCGRVVFKQLNEKYLLNKENTDFK